MLHVFYLDVAKVDLMLHMLQWDPHAADVGVPPSGRKCSRVRLQARAGDVGTRREKRTAGAGVRLGISIAVFL